MVAGGLGSRIGRPRIVTRLFREIPFGAEGTIHFIRAHVIKPAAFEPAGPGAARRVQEGHGAEYIRSHEGHRIADRAVDVAFRSKMDHSLEVIFFKKSLQKICVEDIAFFKNVVGQVLDIAQVFEVAGVSQGIQVHDPVIGMVMQKMADHMRTDKTGATGDEDVFHEKEGSGYCS